jgi:hypothetical protein
VRTISVLTKVKMGGRGNSWLEVPTHTFNPNVLTHLRRALQIEIYGYGKEISASIKWWIFNLALINKLKILLILIELLSIWNCKLLVVRSLRSTDGKQTNNYYTACRQNTKNTRKPHSIQMRLSWNIYPGIELFLREATLQLSLPRQRFTTQFGMDERGSTAP